MGLPKVVFVLGGPGAGKGQKLILEKYFSKFSEVSEDNLAL